jgi:ribulose-5-phosphate 4-epimerase/fuculose-1-phosphate aldolase
MDVLSRMRPEDMVVWHLEGNWVDGPPNSLQCSEVKIHSCLYKNRPDVVSVVHAPPDYMLLMSVLEDGSRPMAQEGIGLVTRPLPLYPRTKIITSGVEGAVLAMVHLEHQARLAYMAMCAAGPIHSSISLRLADEAALGLRGDRPMPEAFGEASRKVSEGLQPDADLHASAEYRRHVAGVLIRRALTCALERAKGEER